MDDKSFRLSEEVWPERYNFTIRVDLEGKLFTSSGTISLVLAAPTRQLVLHGLELDIVHAGTNGNVAHVSSNEVSETITLSFAGELPAGPVDLELSWRGRFNDAMRGLYLAGDVAVTQFEAAEARRVFPCFDEPGFKAVWELAIEAPSELTVLANSPLLRKAPATEGRSLRIFEPTPKIASYLVAFVIGRLESSEPILVNGIPVRSWTVPGKSRLTSFAQECSRAGLELLEECLGHPYPFAKVDNVAIPEFAYGAMENVGLVTYREEILLLDEQEAPLSARKFSANIIIHELAHQWFGNLVTPRWWDDLWLNEAFATWLGYKVLDRWQPGWHVWEDFERYAKNNALRLDAMHSSHPIRTDVADAEAAEEALDDITYEKGCSVVRMVEAWLGEETFREFARLFLRRHAFATGTAEDMFVVLAEVAGPNAADATRGWVDRSGFPLIDVESDGNSVRLSQRRFFFEPEVLAGHHSDLWSIPILLRWSNKAGASQETRHLLSRREATLTLGDGAPLRWLCANSGGAGFYRVRYAQPSLDALLANVGELSATERQTLLSDAWALFRAAAAPAATPLNLALTALDSEDHAVVEAAVSVLVSAQLWSLAPEDRPRFRQLVSSRLGPRMMAQGWDESPGEGEDSRLLRSAIARGLLAVARDQEAVNEAAARLLRHWAGEDSVAPDLLNWVRLAAARQADEALFELLLQRLRAKEGDPMTLKRELRALACIEDEALTPKIIGFLLDENTVPTQDIGAYVSELLINPTARDATFDFIRQQWQPLRLRLAAPMVMGYLVESLADLSHRRAEVEAFLDDEASSLANVPAAVAQTRERLRLDEELRLRGAPQVTEWLAGLPS